MQDKIKKESTEPFYFDYETPIGIIRIEEKRGFLSGLYLQQKHHFSVKKKTAYYRETDFIRKVYGQLMEYFDGKRKVFDLPLYIEGTPFQQKVWNALRQIPYGETRSYGEIAAQVGNPKACRAVGGANHHNPIMIVIPCHRVIGKDGSLTGFGGGIEAKDYMLRLEKGVRNADSEFK